MENGNAQTVKIRLPTTPFFQHDPVYCVFFALFSLHCFFPLFSLHCFFSIVFFALFSYVEMILFLQYFSSSKLLSFLFLYSLFCLLSCILKSKVQVQVQNHIYRCRVQPIDLQSSVLPICYG